MDFVKRSRPVGYVSRAAGQSSFSPNLMRSSKLGRHSVRQLLMLIIMSVLAEL